MPNLKMVVALMGIAAVIIVAMAIYVFLNFSSINLTSSIILIVVGVVVLLIISGIFYITIKGLNPKK